MIKQVSFTKTTLLIMVIGIIIDDCEGDKNTRRGLNCVNFFFFTKLSPMFRVWNIVQSLMQRIM